MAFFIGKIMALLNAAQREECLQECVRELAPRSLTTGNTKPDWRIVINALDDYLDANELAINSAIPQPQRGNFTAKEKALAFLIVTAKRYLL